jgi:tryptophan halogenase
MYPKNIIVIGGGTAGWLTALYVNQLCINSNVTVIESDKIGILGAGEGSVPTLVDLMRKLKIDENEFIQSTKSTFKLGIDFENWASNKSKYEHYFLGERYYSYHFDARLFANYLKGIGLKRGVNLTEGDIINFNTNDNGVYSVDLLDGTVVECDFVFDCSGFKRLILNGVYKGEWESFSSYLTVNSAIPFFLERDDPEMNTATRAIAMKNGWMWMIPLQHRWGCGYVYDDKHINQEQAIQEVEEFLGHKIVNERVIRFDAGCFKEVWVKNTISVGLSTGFIEPLEATSIMTVVKQLFLLDEFFLQENRKSYNESTYDMNEENMLFIFYHYICNRDDSNFWTYYKERKAIPERLYELVDDSMNIKIKLNTELRKIFRKSFSYVLNSWLVVDHGAKGTRKIL